MTAEEFRDTLKTIKDDYPGEIPKREIFSLAKQFQEMPINEIVELLKGDSKNNRLGAISIMDWKARDKKTSESERKTLYDAYMDNHQWIDDWGLVDRAAPYVVGGYLHGKDKGALYRLAQSQNPMERRTAIVSTYFFIRQDNIDDTFNIAEILVDDDDEYVQKAVGSWVREAGKRNVERLRSFLDKYAMTMPRITLRYAIEKLSNQEKGHYMKLKQ